ncbi:homeobox protein ATH1-like isoform X2 [Macadamia integrifolia]|nr:homeobox protein ATH1-like isoform X2 [Macadamia integrifolia]
MAGYPLLPTLQGEQINDIQDNFPKTNHGGIIGSDATASRNMLLHILATRNASVSGFYPVNSDFQEQFGGGESLSSMPFPNILETTSTLQENLDRATTSAPSTFQLEHLRTFISNGCDNSNSSLTGSVNVDYNRGHGDTEFMAPKDFSLPGELDGKWDFEKLFDFQELSVKKPMRTNSDPYCFVGSSCPNLWISSNKSNFSADDSCSYSVPCNELSLSLATSQPSITSVPTIPDQCAEIRCPGFTRPSLQEVGLATGLDLEQTCSKSRDLSLSYGSCKPFHFSHILSGSKYLRVAQQILTELASYSLENIDDFGYSPGMIGTGAKISFSSDCSGVSEISMESDESPYPAGKFNSEDQMEFPLQRQEIEAKKGQLLTLLQLIDNRYNQCLDEIHMVISAFHAATELDPQIHVHFILQTISLLYNKLRERITNQILAIGGLSSGHIREERSFKSSFIQKQWALEQLRRREHHLLRPQRGLPERSVSVLRAWMFQNFLHP